MTEELASVNNMQGKTTGVHIFKEVEQFLSQYNLQWKKAKCILTDGGRRMCGTVKRLVCKYSQLLKMPVTSNLCSFIV